MISALFVGGGLTALARSREGPSFFCWTWGFEASRLDE
jgi:hypothetical protein